MRGPSLQSGHTLAEIAVSMAILAVAAGIAVPELAGVLANMRLRSGMTAITDSLRLTRFEAIRRQGRVAMCKSPDGMHCTLQGDWSRGWIVFHDHNNNADVDADEVVLYREPPVAGGIHIYGNTPLRSYVSYTSMGKAKLLSDAFQAGHFTICAPSTGSTDAYLVNIGSLGHPRVEKARLDHCD